MSSYVPVGWSANQLLDEDTMRQVSSNMNWIREEMVDGMYMHLNGGVTSQKQKIVYGMITVPSRKTSEVNITVALPRFFSAACNPVVTAFPFSTTQNNLRLTGRGRGKSLADHTGFVINVKVDNPNSKTVYKINRFYLQFMAAGY